MEATIILPILKKKLAFLSGKNTNSDIRDVSYQCLCGLMGPVSDATTSGGKDRRSGLILTIPLNSDQTSMEELSTTLDYLLSIPR